MVSNKAVVCMYVLYLYLISMNGAQLYNVARLENARLLFTVAIIGEKFSTDVCYYS